MFGLSRRPTKAPASGGIQRGLIRIPTVGLAAAALLLAPLASGQSNEEAYPFHSPAPAGYSVVLLQPSHTELSILGLVECPQIEGAQKVSRGMRAYVVSDVGIPLKHYPRELSFRVTATLRKILLDGPSDSVASKVNPHQLLLKLGFKLRVYHGLERHDLFPTAVKIIGMPADISYDERVFRVTFNTTNLPMTDRLVLEVLSPEDELLTHFTFGLL